MLCKLNTWQHLTLNVWSTLLFSASGSNLQLMLWSVLLLCASDGLWISMISHHVFYVHCVSAELVQHIPINNAYKQHTFGFGSHLRGVSSSTHDTSHRWYDASENMQTMWLQATTSNAQCRYCSKLPDMGTLVEPSSSVPLHARTTDMNRAVNPNDDHAQPSIDKVSSWGLIGAMLLQCPWSKQPESLEPQDNYLRN